MALENQASSDRAGYRIPVQITESGHVDLARVRWFTSSEVGAAISLKSIWRGRDRCRLWLWPQAALSWIHAERHLRRIVCVTDEQHRLVDVQRQLVGSTAISSSTRTTRQPSAEQR